MTRDIIHHNNKLDDIIIDCTILMILIRLWMQSRSFSGIKVNK